MGTAIVGFTGHTLTTRRKTLIFERLAPGAVVLLVISSLALIVSQRWRWSLIALVVQYAGAFWLVANSWPVGLSAVKLIVGWMAAAVLASSRSSDHADKESVFSLSGWLFNTITAGMVLVVTFSIAPAIHSWLPVSDNILNGGLLLIVMGLLQLGMTSSTLRTALGLLTVLTGFEIIYAALETSVLVAGLLSIVNLGVALAGAYLMIAPSMEGEAQTDAEGASVVSTARAEDHS
jgi:hypothetical protein